MKWLEHGIYFGLFSTAALTSASPKPYVFQSKEEFKSAYTANVENRQPLSLTVGNYSNDFITMGLGLAAAYSLVRLVMSLDNKPIIQQPIHQRPVSQPQQIQLQSQPQSIVIENNNNTTVRAISVSSQPKSRRKPVGTQAKDNSGAWIDSMLFGKNGIVKNQHYKFDGVTQSGKTTLAEYVMSRISESLGGNAEYLLIDPKYLASEPSWSFDPYCKNIDDALEALLDFAEILSERREDPSFDKRTANPIFFIIDEWDWIWLKHKAKALNLLRMLLKVGAELRCFVILLGQSPLCGDSTGLNTSDFEQAVRISIGRTASKVLSIPAHYPYSDRDQLSAEAESLNNQGLRFALVQQHSAKGSIELVPDIQKPNQPQNQEDDLDSLFDFEIPNDKVIPINKKRTVA